MEVNTAEVLMAKEMAVVEEHRPIQEGLNERIIKLYDCVKNAGRHQ